MRALSLTLTSVVSFFILDCQRKLEIIDSLRWIRRVGGKNGKELVKKIYYDVRRVAESCRTANDIGD